ncbi:hypothetical protein [Aquirufa beregesia]
MISFDDETGCIIISTPKGNQIELNDNLNTLKLSDPFSNCIKMDESGIHISSYRDINISGQNIQLKASSNMDLNANMDINCQANNIKQSADASFTAKGGASAELSSSGQTLVKGAMVMIN